MAKINIGAYGFTAYLIADFTFPVGILLSDGADDTDTLEIPNVVINESGMSLNGNLLVWNRANPIKATLALVPGSENDQNLNILFNNNRVSSGRFGSNDTITLVLNYPSTLQQVTLSQGAIMSGMPALSIASQQRLKTRTYEFSFEEVTSA